MKLAVSLLVGLALNAFAVAPVELPLWPAEKLMKLDQRETVVERSQDPTKPNRSIRFVSNPTITVYRPSAGPAPVPAVVICPGGGYGGLAIDKEGHAVARWLNSNGVAGVVLKYRLPRPDLSADQKPWPLQDAQQALRTVRSHAAEWNIDPHRVGIMGFSAGGHLASTVGTHFVDAPTRPDFMVLIYPVITLRDPLGHNGSRSALLGKNPDPKLVELYSNETQVTPQTPPAFLVHAKDDGVKVANSEQFRDALQHAGVACELQLYDTGSHGYGLGVNGGAVATWPARCIVWLKKMQLL